MVRKSYLPILAAIVSTIVICVSCHSNHYKKSVTWDEKNIRMLNVTDTSYLNSIKTAKENIDFFVRVLSNKPNSRFEFFIKSRFSENNVCEHLWFKTDSINNDFFIAVLDNVPSALKRIKYKDTVRICKNDVEDWSIYDGDKLLIGNFIFNSNGK